MTEKVTRWRDVVGGGLALGADADRAPEGAYPSGRGDTGRRGAGPGGYACRGGGDQHERHGSSPSEEVQASHETTAESFAAGATLAAALRMWRNW